MIFFQLEDEKTSDLKQFCVYPKINLGVTLAWNHLEKLSTDRFIIEVVNIDNEELRGKNFIYHEYRDYKLEIRETSSGGTAIYIENNLLSVYKKIFNDRHVYKLFFLSSSNIPIIITGNISAHESERLYKKLIYFREVDCLNRNISNNIYYIDNIIYCCPKNSYTELFYTNGYIKCKNDILLLLLFKINDRWHFCGNVKYNNNNNNIPHNEAYMYPQKFLGINYKDKITYDIDNIYYFFSENHAISIEFKDISSIGVIIDPLCNSEISEYCESSILQLYGDLLLNN